MDEIITRNNFLADCSVLWLLEYDVQAEMDQLERRLGGLVWRQERKEAEAWQELSSVSVPAPGGPGPYLPCPACPECHAPLMPPTQILQCGSGHLVCGACHASAAPPSRACRVCRGGITGRALGLEEYLASLFGSG